MYPWSSKDVRCTRVCARFRDGVYAHADCSLLVRGTSRALDIFIFCGFVIREPLQHKRAKDSFTSVHRGTESVRNFVTIEMAF